MAVFGDLYRKIAKIRTLIFHAKQFSEPLGDPFGLKIGEMILVDHHPFEVVTYRLIVYKINLTPTVKFLVYDWLDNNSFLFRFLLLVAAPACGEIEYDVVLSNVDEFFLQLLFHSITTFVTKADAFRAIQQTILSF